MKNNEEFVLLIVKYILEVVSTFLCHKKSNHFWYVEIPKLNSTENKSEG